MARGRSSRHPHQSQRPIITLAGGVGAAKFLRGLVRAAVFIPWAVPTVVSAEVWKEMFDPQQGFVDYALKLLHLPRAYPHQRARRAGVVLEVHAVPAAAPADQDE